MSDRRRTEGSETWHRLLDWDRGQAAAERLAAQILMIEGYKSVDPSHPLGGPDGLKDVKCIKDAKHWIGACFFPRGQKSFQEIKEKYSSDICGVSKNEASGIVFITNQELRLTERDELHQISEDIELDLIHLERLATLLNKPASYGTRLEFLDIEMTKEEQLAFLAARDEVLAGLQLDMKVILQRLSKEGEKEKELSQEIRTHPAYYITPTISNSTMGVSLDQYRNCSYCGFGFYVRDGWYAITGRRTVTCPKCGNTEYFGITDMIGFKG